MWDGRARGAAAAFAACDSGSSPAAPATNDAATGIEGSGQNTGGSPSGAGGAADASTPECAPEDRERACGSDVGVCASGTQRCKDGKWGACTGDVAPATETCDGSDETCDTQDDDCDGASDEGGNAYGGVCALAPPVGTPCDGGDGDQCDDDAYACNGPNAVQCSAGATNAEGRRRSPWLPPAHDLSRASEG